MRIGYACLALGVPNTEMKSSILKNANEERLTQLINNNLTGLEHLIDYNIANDLRLFRISSDLIPLAPPPLILFLGGRCSHRSFSGSAQRSKTAACGFLFTLVNIPY